MNKVAIVGATGAVGQELMGCLERRDFPVSELVPLASPASAGKTVRFRGEDVLVQVAGEDSFTGVDIAFFSAGATRSRALVPAARAAGALVVDNSSAFRMDEDVPLVVPEVNPGDLKGHGGVVANPNCVAAILTVALAPLRALGSIERLIVSTYQSASGAGAKAMEDLIVQTRDHLAERPVVPRVLPHPYAFNLFSHDSAIEENGFNGEENKVIAETQKILGKPNLAMTVTCVRVPVLRAHTESVHITFDRPVSPENAKRALESAPGVRWVDDPAANLFPMPVEASGEDDVLVGRVRMDGIDDHSLNLLICGDQLLKGAALNSVQIAEALTATHTQDA
ncbi:MAG: aspartate-semialdehyde dehydrogenase [Deltaproteobacteria bacterium]|nr:aspartate-semialdehyde dehydrogenase [Deltaproteobacteria bacterium]